MRVGNKQNSFLNREWAKHVRCYFKRLTAHRRRAIGKLNIQKELKQL